MSWKMILANRSFRIALLLGAGLAAQLQAAQLRAVVPFEFQAGGQRFAAGTYSITDLTREGVLSIENSQRRSRYIPYTSKEYVSRAGTPRLVFARTPAGMVLTDVKAIPGAGDRTVVVKTVRGARVEIALTR